MGVGQILSEEFRLSRETLENRLRTGREGYHAVPKAHLTHFVGSVRILVSLVVVNLVDPGIK